MAVILMGSLYGAAFYLISLVAKLEMSNEVRLAFNVFGGIGALVGPLLAYVAIDIFLRKKVLERIGRTWCQEHGVTLDHVEIHKNHDTIVYLRDGKKVRRKLVVRYLFTTWIVKQIHWT